MLNRLKKSQVLKDLSQFPAVALLGPRQVGKTTLAKQLTTEFSESLHLDLERPSDLVKLNSPEEFLKLHEGKLVIIDEIQLRPDLFPVLRVLIDEHKKAGRFLILGSAAPELLRQSSETLAGRISYCFISPFCLPEIPKSDHQTLKRLIWRGGYPDSYLAKTDQNSRRWRESYIQTFLQRDLQQMGFNLSAIGMLRLWTMCAHTHGDIFNYSKVGQSLDQSHPTIMRHIDLLEGSFAIRRLLPFEINTKKRLVKSPKVFIKDSGLLCSLLQLNSFEDLFSHPIWGRCWEGFAIEQILTALPTEVTHGFFRTHGGQEIDFVFLHKGKHIGVEFKTSSSPKLSKLNYKARDLLKLDELWIVTPNSETFPYDKEGTKVTSLPSFLNAVVLPIGEGIF